MIKEADEELFGLHIDTFHCDRTERAGLLTLLVSDEVRPWISYIHASDSFRNIPGLGNIDWGKVGAALQEISFIGVVTVEVFGQAFAEAVPEIVLGLAESQPLDTILKVSTTTLRDAGIIAPLEG